MRKRLHAGSARKPRLPIARRKAEVILNKPRSDWRRLHSIWDWFRRELRATRPVCLFFLTGFLLVLLVVKLALAQYSISVNALSRALLGAVLAAKVVMVLEKTPISRPFGHSPRIIAILFKSLVYGMSVILFGILERILDALRHAPTMLLGLHRAFLSLNLNRLLSVALGVTIVFGIYFTFAEINEFMGGDALRGLLLRRRTS
jgi:hypothetical protein